MNGMFQRAALIAVAVAGSSMTGCELQDNCDPATYPDCVSETYNSNSNYNYNYNGNGSGNGNGSDEPLYAGFYYVTQTDRFSS